MSQQTSWSETVPEASSASGVISQSWVSSVHRVPPHQPSMSLHHYPSHNLGRDANGPSSFAPLPIAGPSRSVPPSIQPIPAPRPKVAYEAPVFQTFQDRKRAKEAARMALHSTPPKSQQPLPPRPSIQSTSPSTSIPSIPPSPSAIAMMGKPGIPPPTAPPRSPITPPLPHTASDRSRPRSPLPAPPQSATVSSAKASQPEQVQAFLDRSDTISSVKSLDRLGFTSSRRPLPKTPVGVNTSRSLDRGLPKGMGDRTSGRKQPSVVLEEEEHSSPRRTPSIIVPPAPQAGISVPSISLSPTPSQPSLPSVIIDTVDRTSSRTHGEHIGPGGRSSMEAQQSNAGPPSLPVIVMSDDDDRPAKTESIGIALSGLPTIAVTSDQNNTKQSEHTPSGAIVCAGCDSPIIGRIVNAMNQRFHPQCFKCNECGELLEHVSSFEWEGKAYCHLDYHDVSRRLLSRLMAEICSSMLSLQDTHCGQSFRYSERSGAWRALLPRVTLLLLRMR